MPSFRVALDGAVCIVGTDAQLKVNPETNQPVTDRETNARLFTLQVMLMEEGRAEMLKVTVPETGLPNGLKPGVAVMPLGLVASPWARLFNGQLREGVTFRTTALTLLQPAAPTAEEPPAADLAAEQLKAATAREQSKKTA